MRILKKHGLMNHPRRTPLLVKPIGAPLSAMETAQSIVFWVMAACFIPITVFSVLGLVAFVTRPGPPPTPPPLPPFQAPLTAGEGIILDNNGGISLNTTFEMLGDTMALGEIVGVGNISSPLIIHITGISDGSSNMVEVIGPTVVSPGAKNMVQLSDGRLQYVGNRTAYCHTATTLSVSCVSTDQIYVLMLGKNGTLLSNGAVLQSSSNGGDITALAIHTYVVMEPYDYLSLFVGNIVSISDFAIYTANGFVMCMDLSMVSMKK